MYGRLNWPHLQAEILRGLRAYSLQKEAGEDFITELRNKLPEAVKKDFGDHDGEAPACEKEEGRRSGSHSRVGRCGVSALNSPKVRRS